MAPSCAGTQVAPKEPGGFDLTSCIYFCLVLFWLLLPSGTAPPLIALVLVGICWLVTGQKADYKSALRPWFWPVIALLCLSVAGLWHSLDRELGMDYALKGKYWILAPIFTGLCLKGRRVFHMVAALWAGLGIGVVLAVGQRLGWLPPNSNGYMGYGVAYTFCAPYLVFGMLMAGFYYQRTQRRLYRMGLIFLIAAFIGHLSLLHGRIGYLLILITVPMIVNQLANKMSRGIKLVICIAVIAGLCLSPAVQSRMRFTFGVLKTNKERLLKCEDVADAPRLWIYSQAIKAFNQSPVFGIGTGSFTEFTRPTGHTVTHPHNNLLYMLMSYGVPGGLVFFWLFGTLFYIAWPRRHTELGYFVLSVGWIIFVAGMFDTSLLNSQTLIMFSVTYGFLYPLQKMPKGRAVLKKEELVEA